MMTVLVKFQDDFIVITAATEPLQTTSEGLKPIAYTTTPQSLAWWSMVNGNSAQIAFFLGNDLV